MLVIIGAKNAVIEQTLKFVNKFCQHHGLKTFKEADEFIGKYGFNIGQNLDLNVKGFKIEIKLINYEIRKSDPEKGSSVIGLLSIERDSAGSVIIRQKDLNGGSINVVNSSLFPNIYHVINGIRGTIIFLLKDYFP